MVKTVLVIGGNKGIGLGLVKEFVSAAETRVIATARTSTAELDKISAELPGKLTVLKLDTSDKESILAFGKELHIVAKDGIDIFVGNAGVGTGLLKKVLDVSYEDFLQTYQINVVGLVFSLKEAHDLLLLRPTRQVIFISSGAGQVKGPSPVGSSSYGASKAALNHVCISLGKELKEEGIAVAAVYPGPVDTEAFRDLVAKNLAPEQSKAFTPKTTAECADAVVNKITPQVTLENTGKVFDITGEIVTL